MTFRETLMDDITAPASSPPPELEANGVLHEFAEQAEKLSHHHPVNREDDEGVAVEARFVTPQDPVVVTADGSRLPAVPLKEAHKLNVLREEAAAQLYAQGNESHGGHVEKPKAVGSAREDARATEGPAEGRQKSPDSRSLRRAMPPSHTNPLFPPLPLYGPPSLLRDIQCLVFRVSSFFLSLAFLAVIVLGALFTSIGPAFRRLWLRATSKDPDANRPFYAEEMRRKRLRKKRERQWKQRQSASPGDGRAEGSCTGDDDDDDDNDDGFVPTEGGPDPIVCDPAYYARRVGLDIEMFEVQTEDGFIIELWHVYDPREYTPLPPEERRHGEPETFDLPPKREPATDTTDPSRRPRFPVLLMHGLLQSSGAYCVNDASSLAFYLCRSGFDVWLGNNRCGFRPRHVSLARTDPRMWCWNIRQMGVFDLPALAARVLRETGFARLGLVAHSQGTTQALVALAKEQRPDFGERLTVFCALAPAAYAGPLVGRMRFKFMRVISPGLFRLMFGIHAFIPFMMDMHRLLPPRLYGRLGYSVFSFLFDWTDERWDRGLRDRMFRFAPVYVSAESMRWWLGRECFARHKCILSTKEERRAEEREDREHERGHGRKGSAAAAAAAAAASSSFSSPLDAANAPRRRQPKGSTAWYNHQAPPFALWVCGNDRLVDGEKLLRRFERGREPHVRVVHSKVISGYEHLDVIWAMDAVDQVFREVREVLWKTCDVRDICRVPRGCEKVAPWTGPEDEEAKQEEEGDGLQSSSSEELSA
ncbi:hypothetical protein VTK26DRAFT_7454 [Humicola hyalothermophila]